MAYDPTHHVLAVINGDPGLPFITFIDMSYIVGASTGTRSPTLRVREICIACQLTCLWLTALILSDIVPHLMRRLAPLALIPTLGSDPGFFVIRLQGTGTGIWEPEPAQTGTPCRRQRWTQASAVRSIRRVALSGRFITTAQVARRQAGIWAHPHHPGGHRWKHIPMPRSFQSTCVQRRIGSAAADGPTGLPGFGTTPSGVTYTIPCHHGPIISYATGALSNQTPPCADPTCAGAIAPAGLGGMAYDPNATSGC